MPPCVVRDRVGVVPNDLDVVPIIFWYTFGVLQVSQNDDRPPGDLDKVVSPFDTPYDEFSVSVGPSPDVVRFTRLAVHGQVVEQVGVLAGIFPRHAVFAFFVGRAFPGQDPGLHNLHRLGGDLGGGNHSVDREARGDLGFGDDVGLGLVVEETALAEHRFLVILRCDVVHGIGRRRWKGAPSLGAIGVLVGHLEGVVAFLSGVNRGGGWGYCYG